MTGIELMLLLMCMTVLGVALLVFMVRAIPTIVFRSMEASLARRIASHYRPDDILLQDLQANSFGRQAAGVGLLRGNGGLVLTERQLHFFLFTPEADLCIPFDAISDVRLAKSHRDQHTTYDLLKVSFSMGRKADSIAWQLPDPYAWKRRIDALRTGGDGV